MILKSEKVILRPFAIEDLDQINLWRGDKDLRLMSLMHPYPVSMEQDRDWLEYVTKDISNKNIYLAAERNKDKEMIGYFQLRDINLIHKHAFLGIIIGNTSDRGKGYGKEMMKLGLDYGFKMLGLEKISLEVLETNERAIKLYETIGFKQEGKFNNHFFFDGQWHHVVRMAKFK